MITFIPLNVVDGKKVLFKKVCLVLKKGILCILLVT